MAICDFTNPRCTFDHLELEETVGGIGEEEAVVIILARRTVTPDEVNGEREAVLGQFTGETEGFGFVDLVRFAVDELQTFVGKTEHIWRELEINATGSGLEHRIETDGGFVELLGRGLEVESVLLDLFRREFNAKEAVRQSSFGYKLAERKEREQAVGFGFGELLSAEVDVVHLFVDAFKADEGAVKARIDNERRAVGARRYEVIQGWQQPSGNDET